MWGINLFNIFSYTTNKCVWYFLLHIIKLNINYCKNDTWSESDFKYQWYIPTVAMKIYLLGSVIAFRLCYGYVILHFYITYLKFQFFQ